MLLPQHTALRASRFHGEALYQVVNSTRRCSSSDHSAAMRNLLQARGREYHRVAESELAHVSGSRSGVSCALVSALALMTCWLPMQGRTCADVVSACVLQLSVQGMTCSACTSAVENALRCAAAASVPADTTAVVQFCCCVAAQDDVQLLSVVCGPAVLLGRHQLLAVLSSLSN